MAKNEKTEENKLLSDQQRMFFKKAKYEFYRYWEINGLSPDYIIYNIDSFLINNKIEIPQSSLILNFYRKRMLDSSKEIYYELYRTWVDMLITQYASAIYCNEFNKDGTEKQREAAAKKLSNEFKEMFK